MLAGENIKDMEGCFLTQRLTESELGNVESYNIYGGLSGLGEDIYLDVVHEMKEMKDIRSFLVSGAQISRIVKNKLFKWSVTSAVRKEYEIWDVPMDKVDIDEFLSGYVPRFSKDNGALQVQLVCILDIVLSKEEQRISLLLKSGIVGRILELLWKLKKQERRYFNRDERIFQNTMYCVRILLQITLHCDGDALVGNWSADEFYQLVIRSCFNGSCALSSGGLLVLERWKRGLTDKKQLFENTKIPDSFFQPCTQFEEWADDEGYYCQAIEDFVASRYHLLCGIVEGMALGVEFDESSIKQVKSAVESIDSEISEADGLLKIACSYRESNTIRKIRRLIDHFDDKERSIDVEEECRTVTVEGCTMIHYLCMGEAERRLIELSEMMKEETGIYKKLIDHENKYGKTALYIASSCGNLKAVEFLIESGADINKADNQGQTPLYIASSHGHLSVVQLLIRAGADVNEADYDGQTPLFQASAKGHLSIVESLIHSGATMNQAGDWCTTPLHAAAANGHKSIVKSLTNSGANVITIDLRRTDPEDYGQMYSDLTKAWRLLHS